MANYSLESLVIELQKTVGILVSKVEMLESVITEQSGIIANLNPSTTFPTRKSLTPIVPLPTTSAAQRPVRKARTHASLAIAKLAKPTKKHTDVRASTDAAAAPKNKVTPDKLTSAVTMNEICTKHDQHDDSSNLPTGMDKNVAETISNMDQPANVVVTTTASRVTTAPIANVQGSPTTLDEENDSPWQIQHHRRRTTKLRKILTGSGKTDDTLQTVEEMKFIQVWSLKPDTTEENIKNYLEKIRTCDRYIVKKRVIKTDTHAAFEIGLPQSLYDVVSSPESWPPGVKISDWFRWSPRRWTRRGSLGTAGPSSDTSAERSVRI